MDIGSMYEYELESLVRDAGLPKFRAAQIYSWIHEKGVSGYEEMTNLPKTMREMLAEAWPLPELTPVRTLSSKDGDTTKYLFRLADGNVIECVRM